MKSYVWGAAAAITSAWGYLTYIQPAIGAKYYVSQQLAQMQAHRFNKARILQACRGETRLRKLVEQIFKDYERDIEFKKWCWVKTKKNNKTKWACLQNAAHIGHRQKFHGIFPPIASLESTIEYCDEDIPESTWLNKWKSAFKGYATGYFSNLENYVPQLEAIEQDMSAFAFKLRM